MKHLVAGIATCAVVAMASAAFAQLEIQSLEASVTFQAQETPTTFSLYTAPTGTTPWTAIELDNGAAANPDIAFGADVRYIASQNYYVEVEPGNYGNWYLCVYTSNASEPTFNPENGSNLFLYDGSKQSCIWKYRNSVIFDSETRAVGTSLPAYDWSGDDASYKYFANVSTGAGVAAFDGDTRNFASLLNYTTSWDYNVRIAMAFAIDMSTVVRVGEYSADLNFEVYYE